MYNQVANLKRRPLIDEKSLEILEFSGVKKILARYTSFSVSKDLVLNLKPSSDYDEVALLLRQSAEARYLLSADRGFATSGVFDVREEVRLAALGKILDTKNLVEIKQTLSPTRQVRSSLNEMSKEVPLIWDIAKDIEDLPGIEREIARLLQDSRKRKFDVLLVWALDRLSREGSLAILSLVNRLKISGVKVISYQESWTEAPGDLAELLYALTGWVARMESQRRNERTRAGLARVKAQGKRLGRPSGSKDRRKRRRRLIAA